MPTPTIVASMPTWTDIGQFYIQALALVGGALGIFYTIQQVRIARKTFEFNSTPILLHLGFFDFFKEDKRPNNLSVSQLQNVGERPCFNIRGWCVTNGEFHRLIFGKLSEDPETKEKQFRGDYKYTWAGKSSTIDFTIMKPPLTRIDGIQDHVLFLYEDNERKQYFTYLDKTYSYQIGLFDNKRTYKTISISRANLNKMLGYST